MSGPAQVGDGGDKLLVESLYKKEPELEGRVSRKEKYLGPCIAVVTGSCVGGPHTTVLMA